MEREKKNLAIFDFDGTITKGDSFLHFLKFMVGSKRYYSGLFQLSPWLVAYKAGILPNYKAKEKVTKWFFSGMDQEVFNKACVDFLPQLDRLVKKSAMEKIRHHKTEGHQIVVVSASFENYLGPWCASNELDCMGTRLEVKKSRLTGKFHGRNCFGYEKVRRLEEKYVLDDYETIHVYGDSPGDKEILRLGHVKNYRNLH